MLEINEWKKTRKIVPSINQIEGKLFLGNEDAAVTLKVLKERGISAILVCGSHLDTPFKLIQYKILQIADDPRQKIIHLFEEAIDFVSKKLKAGKGVLIHCQQGRSRSASFTIAYMMKTKRLSYEESYAYVKSKREEVEPNPGFQAQLRMYEQKLKNEKKAPTTTF